MAASPIFAATPKIANIILNNANGGDASYINPTTIATVLTVGATGANLNTIFAQPAGTNAACVVRVFLDTLGTGGVANRLLQEIPLVASTSTTGAALAPNFWNANIPLPANSVLRMTVSNTAVTNGVAMTVVYGEF